MHNVRTRETARFLKKREAINEINRLYRLESFYAHTLRTMVWVRRKKFEALNKRKKTMGD